MKVMKLMQSTALKNRDTPDETKEVNEINKLSYSSLIYINVEKKDEAAFIS